MEETVAETLPRTLSSEPPASSQRIKAKADSWETVGNTAGKTPSEEAAELELAVKLHDDIYNVLREKNIDRFGKYAIGNDVLTQTAIKRVKNRQGKRVSARFSIGYWKNWTETMNILEVKSEQVKQEEKIAELAATKTGKKPQYASSAARQKKKTKGPRDRVRGLPFGPPDAAMPPLYRHTDPNFQLPVEALFAEVTRAPAPLDPAAMPKPIETPTCKGGDMSGAPRLPRPVKSLTAQCDIKMADELMGSIFKKPVSFTNANRFKSDRNASTLGCYLGPDKLKSENYQGKFLTAGRLRETTLYETLNATPAPNEYSVSGMFDSTLRVPSAEMKTRQLAALTMQRSMRDQSATELAKVATFGFGCSLEEHRKYGLCLDGMCGRRGRTEDVILLTNKVDLFKGDMAAGSRRPRYPRDDHVKRVFASPMQAAVISGDFNRVSTLVNLGANINEIDPITRRAAIHEAVIRGYSSLVAQMCEAYAVRSPDHPVHKIAPPEANTTGKVDPPQQTRGAVNDEGSVGGSVGSHANTSLNDGPKDPGQRELQVMRLDLKDIEGDTVFHYCARLGHQEILETLCDAAVKLIDLPNKTGDHPSDIAKTHLLFQLVSTCNDRIKLQNQLRGIKKEKRRLIRSHRQHDGEGSYLDSSHSSMPSSRGCEYRKTGSRQGSTTRSVMEIEPSDARSDCGSSDSGSQDTIDLFEHDNDTERSGSFSKQSEKKDVFAKFRRHSFRVGYFVDEDSEKVAIASSSAINSFEHPHVLGKTM